ncbi:MAG: hypothetical protein IKY71_00070 [Bacteroidaceae bacterium]|nr:hypothetical protein [Bacteroidaceae bacterium]
MKERKLRVSEQEPNLFEFLQQAEAGSTKSKEKVEGKKIFRFAQDDSIMILCHFSGKPSTTRLNGVKNL